MRVVYDCKKKESYILCLHMLAFVIVLAIQKLKCTKVAFSKYERLL